MCSGDDITTCNGGYHSIGEKVSKVPSWPLKRAQSIIYDYSASVTLDSSIQQAQANSKREPEHRSKDTCGHECQCMPSG